MKRIGSILLSLALVLCTVATMRPISALADEGIPVSEGTEEQITWPTAKENLTYNGVNQLLVNEGSVENGILVYAVTENAGTVPENSDFTEVPPGAVDAKTWYVWYKIVDTEQETDAAYISVEIAKKKVTVTAKAQSVDLGGAIADDTNQVEVSGLEELEMDHYLISIALTADTSVGGTFAQGIVPSEAAIWDGDEMNRTDNFEITYVPGELTVNKAENGIKKAPAGLTLTYDGSLQTLVSQGETTAGEGAGTFYYRIGTTGDFSSEMPEGRDAGTYTIYYYLDGGSSYESVGSETNPAGSVTATIAKKDLTVTAKNQTVTLNRSIVQGTDQVTCSGLAEGDTVSAVTMTATSTAAVTENGTITLSEMKITNGDNEDVTSNYNITCQTGKLTVTDLPDASLTENPLGLTPTYNGGKQKLITEGGAEGGTIYYRLKSWKSITGEIDDTSGEWSDQVPEGLMAGTYIVEYYVKGDAGYNNLGSETNPAGSMTVTIAQKDVTIKANDQNFAVNGGITEGPDQVTCTGLAGNDILSEVYFLTLSEVYFLAEGNIIFDYVVIVEDGTMDERTENYNLTYVPGNLLNFDPRINKEEEPPVANKPETRVDNFRPGAISSPNLQEVAEGLISGASQEIPSDALHRLTNSHLRLVLTLSITEADANTNPAFQKNAGSISGRVVQEETMAINMTASIISRDSISGDVITEQSYQITNPGAGGQGVSLIYQADPRFGGMTCLIFVEHEDGTIEEKKYPVDKDGRVTVNMDKLSLFTFVIVDEKDLVDSTTESSIPPTGDDLPMTLWAMVAVTAAMAAVWAASRFKTAGFIKRDFF